ncbi:MAG: carboxypeptidase-like regulatory domain-containing protein [Flavobacterium sp.]|nr:MAG: carboxypeptidase-like regulatory domain-containing protein [Flavobacterium sp.]
MKNNWLVLFLLISITASAQIKGRVVSKDGKPVPYASAVISGTYNGTSSNENGLYQLNVTETGKYTVIFRSLGYKTIAVTTDISKFPHTLDVTLEDEVYTLNEIVVSNTNNPANGIIRKAIDNRKQNSEKTAQFEADFYSRGIFRLKDVTDNVLGFKVGNLKSVLDPSGSGVLYLSETVSKIKYKKPDNLQERIIASKISGSDNGYSFNNAASADFDFYNDYIEFGINAISPIGSNAFSYYRYALESTFEDESGHLINKIRVTPKRPSEPAMDGYVYIVDDSWALYAVDLTIKGSQIQQDLLNTLTVKQNFGYNAGAGIWARNVQVLDFDASLFGTEVSGRFSYVYSNYNFSPGFDKRTFGNEILSFEEDANKRPNSYWFANRPIPLTREEIMDYTKKDSLQAVQGTTAYKDSIDKVGNKFKWLSPITGYNYNNSNENWTISYLGILKKLGFNTVQAYHLAPSFYFTKRDPEKLTYTTFGTDLNYGFAEKRFRATGTISRKFNNFSQRIITLSGGSSIEQFNPERPINRIVNSISTLFFRDNYMKLYDHNFLRLSYQEEVVNGIYLFGTFEYTRKRSLFNNTDFSTFKDIYDDYTSNNPQLPNDYTTPSFQKHGMLKGTIATSFFPGQKYQTRPDGKIVVEDTKLPKLFLRYEKGFASTVDDYNFDHLSARVTYDITIGNKGQLGTSFRGGKFFNSENIAFTDYRHFNGNQTYVGKSERYLNVFNLLPYYTHSTNDSYFEAHAEHNFNGFITNKIPFLNRLDYHVVAGYHMLAIPEQKPYMEFSVGLDNLGWGKFRFLRVDYVRSYESGFKAHGVIFGITFLDFLE